MRLATLILASALATILGGCCITTVDTGEYGAPLPQGVVRRGALLLDGVPPIPKAISERLRDYQNTRSASLAAWHPKGDGMLIATRFGSTTQLHHLAMPMGARRQLTFFEEPLSNGSFLPDGHRIVYSQDAGGSENDQLFLHDLRDGTRKLLTDGKSRHDAYLLSKTEPLMAFSSSARNGFDTDVYVQRLDPIEPARIVVKEGGAWGPIEFSPDHRELLVGRYVSVVDSMVYRANLETGTITPLIDVPPGEKVVVGGARYSKRGDGAVYFESDRDSEFQRLCRRNADGTIDVLTADLDWDVSGYNLSDDGEWLAFSINAGGYTELFLVELATNQRQRIDDPAEPTIHTSLSFSPDSRQLAVGMLGPRTPGDIHTYRLDTKTWTRWTASETGGIDASRFIVPQRIVYPSFDGKQISAFYYRPEGPGPFPVLINFHGGPEGQSRPWFNPFFQYLAKELKIAVLDPNVRGSTGYGKSFVKLDDGFLREDSVKDGGALLDWIAGNRELDSGRVAVNGGSYGGYMVLAMLTTYPERVRAGIDSVGISNFVTFLKNTADYRRDLRRVEYGDERDPKMAEFLERISPLTKADRIRSALYVLQGKNDPRVPWTEAEQIVKAARANGANVWYTLAENEGHGFARKENRDFQQESVVLFLRTHLLDDTTP